MRRSAPVTGVVALALSSLAGGALSCGDADRSKLEGAASAAKESVVAAKAKLFGLTEGGAISDQGLEWLAKQKPAEGSATPGGIEGVVARGAQIAPVVIEARQVMNQAVDEETVVEPIYQRVEPGKEPELDASIKAMPRVEVIDGVTIGFKKLDAIETTKIHKEQAVLVMWRKEDRLIGFLYRSHRTIDVAVVVKETPRMMALMHAAAK